MFSKHGSVVSVTIIFTNLPEDRRRKRKKKRREDAARVSRVDDVPELQRKGLPGTRHAPKHAATVPIQN